MKKFTDMETTVLRSLFESSEGNGHDFGFIEDAQDKVGKKQLGGVVASLVKKDVITVHEAVRNDSGVWTQFTFDGHDDFPRDFTFNQFFAMVTK